jgi:PIN domain nuclease of toxin-antitoxin system
VRLLLDTHVLLALLKPDPPLRQAYRDLLADERSELLVSVANLWEIAIKVRSAKLNLDVPIASLPEHLLAWNCRLLKIGADQVLTELETWPETQDPFDRLLLAVAQVEECALVTWDKALLTHPLTWRPGSA